MRVLLTTDTIGGVWTYTKELTEGLLERSHSVLLISLGRSPSVDQLSWCAAIAAKYARLFEYIASETALEWMEDNVSAYVDAEPLLVQTTHSFKADVFHTNQYCFGKLPVAVPRLVVAHSDVLSWAEACRPSALQTSEWLNRYHLLVQHGLLAADGVVAPTRWMLEALAHNFTLPNEVFVIPNGRSVPPPSTPVMRKLQAVSAGRFWDPAKGLSILTKIAAPFPILIAGDILQGEQATEAAYGQVTFLGHQSERDLDQTFRQSAIYLALSVYEPFGLAPLEAALCGCALIVRDLESFREVWGDAALYFQNAGMLSFLLKLLGEDAQLLKTYQDRAFRRALKMNRTQMTEEYLNIYERLLSSSRGNKHLAASPEVTHGIS